MQEDLDTVLKRLNVGDRLTKLAVSSTGFVFDPQTGQSFSLNHSGMAALEVLKQTASIECAARRLADIYKIPMEIAETSLYSFVVQLGRYL